MDWPKLAIAAVLLAVAIAAALTWHKGASNVVVPVTLVALYVVWRWRRDLARQPDSLAGALRHQRAGGTHRRAPARGRRMVHELERGPARRLRADAGEPPVSDEPMQFRSIHASNKRMRTSSSLSPVRCIRLSTTSRASGFCCKNRCHSSSRVARCWPIC